MNAPDSGKRATVSMVKCRDYSDEERVYRSLKDLLSRLGGIEKFVKRGEKILIKPNLLAGDAPEKAVTTHPTVIAGVVRLVKEAGGDPLIGDSPCISRFESVIAPTGMTEVAEKHGAKLVGLSTQAEVSVPNGLIIKRLVVAQEVLDADAIISVSKLKTHNYTVLTGAVKNMFGVVPGLVKGNYHLQMPQAESFMKMILDIYRRIPARLHVMDGIWAMEGEKGPRAGKPKQLGILIASEDGIAVDAVASSVVGMEAQAVPTTRIGNDEGIGVGDPARIDIVGASLEEVRVSGFDSVKKPSGLADRLPPFLFKLLRNYVSNKPRINCKGCKLCMTCFKACPPRAIERKRMGKRLCIDYNLCIRCYCCLESCPHGAIDIKKGLLVRLGRC
jgi:uncharacterized protein (DUF362 family)/Pyruvate/2-oxoacid:ferredoxin oxidoreductase delta subunit